MDEMQTIRAKAVEYALTLTHQARSSREFVFGEFMSIADAISDYIVSGFKEEDNVS